MASIKLVGTGPLWGLPSASPFVLKLETWLRMAGIAYESVALTRPPASRSGKIPYLIRADGSLLADSGVIIETLAAERGIDLGGRDAAVEARAHLVLRTVEESLYFVQVWERWWDDAHWPTTRDAYFRALPGGLRHLVGAGMRRRVKRDLWGQGIARHEPARIAAIGAADLAALAGALGGHPYFGGESAALVDASAYGSLAGILAYPVDTSLQAALKQYPVLLDYVERMREAFW